MTIENRTIEFIEYLNGIKFNAFLTDAYKEQIKFNLKLTGVKPELPFIEIIDEKDYENVIKHIKDQIDFPNFQFESDTFDENKKYLYLPL